MGRRASWYAKNLTIYSSHTQRSKQLWGQADLSSNPSVSTEQPGDLITLLDAATVGWDPGALFTRAVF